MNDESVKEKWTEISFDKQVNNPTGYFENISQIETDEYNVNESSKTDTSKPVINIHPTVKAYLIGLEQGIDIGRKSMKNEMMTEGETNMSLERDVTDLKVSTGKIDTDIDYIKKTLDKIMVNTDKISVIENDIKHMQGDMDKLEKKKKWWQQYLLLPLITGVIGGIVVALLIALFKIRS